MKQIHIKLTDWDYQCGDGCCTSWGTNIEIDGEEIDSIEFSYSTEVEAGLTTILNYLGYEPIIEYGDETTNN